MKSTDTDKVAEKVATILLETGSVVFRPSQPFRYTTGILSPIYVDNRRLISLPKERKIIARYFTDKIREIGVPDVIAGTATAAIPHASWVADSLNLPMVYVRSKPKGYGHNNQVEGILRKGQRVIVIEDVISTGTTSVTEIQILRKMSAQVTSEISIYTHALKESAEKFKRIGVKLYCLTDLFTITSIAQKLGYLRPQHQETVFAWNKNPKRWGQKMGFE